MKTKLKCLSFFSGCLGLDLGLEKSGIEHLLYCENDPHAIKTIKKNKPKTPLIHDILDYDSKTILAAAGVKNSQNIDIIVGGPPCQAFSTAGRRASFNDPRGNIFLHFIDIICQLKPKYFVLENVRGLLSAALKHRPHSERGLQYKSLSEEETPGGALKTILEKLYEFDYDISFNLYNSANFGVPQTRERLIIIGSRSGKRVPYLQPTHSEIDKYELPKWLTFRDIAYDLNNNKSEHINFSKNRIKYYSMLKNGQNWKDLPNDVVKDAMGKSYNSGGGKTGFYRRIDWDKPSPTLVTHPAMPATDLCHPEHLRPLSVQEYKRIQQFPDSFDITGTTLQKYKQIGNAVPVGLGEVIGKTLINHSNGIEIENPKFANFPYSRYKNTSDKTWNFNFKFNLEK